MQPAGEIVRELADEAEQLPRRWRERGAGSARAMLAMAASIPRRDNRPAPLGTLPMDTLVPCGVA
jgi:hypothetical protein